MIYELAQVSIEGTLIGDKDIIWTLSLRSNNLRYITLLSINFTLHPVHVPLLYTIIKIVAVDQVAFV